MTPNAREVARRVLRRVEQERAYATLALSGEIARAKLDPRDAALATEIVYGVLRREARIDRALTVLAPRGLGNAATRIALRVAAYQLVFLRVPAHAAVDDAVEAVKAIAGPKVAAFANAVLRKLATTGEPPRPEDPLARAELEQPRWLVDRLALALGPGEAPVAAEAFNEAPPVVLRVSLSRARREAVVTSIQLDRPDATLDPSPLADEAIVTRGLGNPETLRAFQDGLVTVQDLAAQRVGRMLLVESGERVLDACAGVGGKSTHLAELGAARVDAMDLSRRKLDLAEDAARRLHVADRIRFVEADLTKIALEPYDRVLLDAPCSGLGVLRRHPEAKKHPPDVAALAALQRQLLERVAAVARKALVYSVCTFTVEEGAAQIASFLAAHPEWREAERLTTWPHRDGGDAFFAVRLQRI
jgi:16S rRNA (cytosine967-C5)-methyltransferase